MTAKSKTETQKKAKFTSKNSVNVFTDIIQINVSNETVHMELAILSTDKETATVSHDVIMTIPHFVRFSEVCNQISEQIISKVNEENNKKIKS